jgi:hypothetical protein
MDMKKNLLNKKAALLRLSFFDYGKNLNASSLP